MIPLYELLEVVKFIEIERTVVARGWVKKRMVVVISWVCSFGFAR